MTTFDFTLANPAIRDYFTGVSDSAPISEFLYLHTHPLVTDNFISEIRTLLDDSLSIYTGGLPEPVQKKLVDCGLVLGTNALDLDVSEVARPAAEKMLEAFRELYKLTGVQIENIP